MKKTVFVVLTLVLSCFSLAAENLFPPEPPSDTLSYQVDLGEGWSRGQKINNPDYQYGWQSKKGNMVLTMYIDTKDVEPIPGREQLERFLADYDGGVDGIEWSIRFFYSDYLERWLESPIVSYRYGGKSFVAWSDFRFDYFPVLVVVSVPREDFTRRQAEMLDIIFKF